jgi:hypothetical protein
MQITTNGDGTFKATLRQLSERIGKKPDDEKGYVLTTGLVRFLVDSGVAKKTGEVVPNANGRGKGADVYEFPGSFEIKL